MSKSAHWQRETLAFNELSSKWQRLLHAALRLSYLRLNTQKTQKLELLPTSFLGECQQSFGLAKSDNCNERYIKVMNGLSKRPEKKGER